MTFYHRLGEVPPKRHTQFRDEEGNLYAEELVSSKGFSGIHSILYHKHPPTRVRSIKDSVPFQEELAMDYPLRHSHVDTSRLSSTGEDYLEARKLIMGNTAIKLSLLIAQKPSMDYFYKNGEHDEVVFVHEGKGKLLSQFGELPVKQGDYVVIPRTTIYRFDWSVPAVRLLIIESTDPIETVKRYRNELGQLGEHSPYCERDIRPPQQLLDRDMGKPVSVKIKKAGFIHHYLYDFSPGDVVGWDGYLYPYALSIHDFEPITGRIHQPPPVHQTFQMARAVICSFVPRLFDYHPLAIPAPYNHSNIDSDEVLYYAEGNFMSRKGIKRGSFTLHPGGIPHGPHPGTVEKSIGAEKTEELAVMIDTFDPLYLAKGALDLLDEQYPMSWSK